LIILSLKRAILLLNTMGLNRNRRRSRSEVKYLTSIWFCQHCCNKRATIPPKSCIFSTIHRFSSVDIIVGAFQASSVPFANFINFLFTVPLVSTCGYDISFLQA